MEPEEKKTYTLIQQLNTIRNQKVQKKKMAQRKRTEEFVKVKAKEEAERTALSKKRRKEFYRKVGAKRTKTSAGGGKGGDE
jgi:ribosome biogenesis protein BMS1